MRLARFSAALLAAALAALWLLPGPAAAQTGPGQGERVDVTAAEFPPAVLADRTFYINVTVANREGAEQRITLFATLYEGTSPTPCEGARAQQTLSKFQKSVTLRPGQEVRVEGERDHWAQVVNGSRIGADGTFEVCVWARLAQCPQQADLAACFLDYHRLQLAVRLVNAPPQPTARVEPAQGTTATPFVFTATAQDANRDEVRYRWDFGDGSRGEGARVTHAYRTAGNYTATVNATDGIDTAEARVRVQVAAGPAGGGGGVPGFEPLLLAAALALSLAARRARGPR